MKKIFVILLAFLVTLNFSLEVYAKTAEEKAAEKQANKEFKMRQKQAKEIAKAARKANIQKVMQWAEEGDIQAQMILSFAYHHGMQVKHNYKISDEWKAKVVAENPVYAENFIPTEYLGQRPPLRRLYGIAAYRAQVGIYVKPDYEKALRWAELGAMESDTWSLAFVGSAYYTGRGVQQDYKTAMEYFKKAPQEPLSLLLMSDAYAKGNGVEKDLQKSKLYADYLKLVQQPKIDRKKDRNLKKKKQ